MDYIYIYLLIFIIIIRLHQHFLQCYGEMFDSLWAITKQYQPVGPFKLVL